MSGIERLGAQPLAYSAAGAASACGVGVTLIREQLRLGVIPRHYAGRKPLILASDLLDWLASLPVTAPAPEGAGEANEAGTTIFSGDGNMG